MYEPAHHRALRENGQVIDDAVVADDAAGANGNVIANGHAAGDGDAMVYIHTVAEPRGMTPRRPDEPGWQSGAPAGRWMR